MHDRPLSMDDYLKARKVSYPYRPCERCLENDPAEADYSYFTSARAIWKCSHVYIFGSAGLHPYFANDIAERFDLFTMGLTC